MINLKTLSILTISTFGLYAVTADASEQADAQTSTQMTLQNSTVIADTQDRLSQTPNALIPVTDKQGRIFYNHVIAVEDLPDPGLDVTVEDTYTYEYKGRLYTNIIVAPS